MSNLLVAMSKNKDTLTCNIEVDGKKSLKHFYVISVLTH